MAILVVFRSVLVDWEIDPGWLTSGGGVDGHMVVNYIIPCSWPSVIIWTEL